MVGSVKRFLDKQIYDDTTKSRAKATLCTATRMDFHRLLQMEECAKRYGNIFTLELSRNTPPLVVVSHPQALQEILTNDTEKFTSPKELNTEFEQV